MIALVFIGIPFIVRAVQPVLEKMDDQYEEAAYMLGATPTRTFFKVILPELRPALLTGFGLAFARGIGEYGSVIYISGNSAKEHTQMISYVIMQKLNYIDYKKCNCNCSYHVDHFLCDVICDQYHTGKTGKKSERTVRRKIMNEQQKFEKKENNEQRSS